MAAYSELEAEYEGLIGKKKLDTLKEILSELATARRQESP
jgi:hypothetical protein